MIGSRSLSTTLTDHSLSQTLMTATSTTEDTAVRPIATSQGEKSPTCTFLFSLYLVSLSQSMSRENILCAFRYVIILSPFICPCYSFFTLDFFFMWMYPVMMLINKPMNSSAAEAIFEEPHQKVTDSNYHR